MSEVAKNREFEDTTRTSALEIVGTLAESLPTLMRQHVDQLKTHLMPSLCMMMTELEHEDDLEAWANEEDTELQAKNDPASVAADILQRMASDLGEKTILACSSDLLKAAIGSQNWKEKCMGFMFLGMISEACKKSFK